MMSGRSLNVVIVGLGAVGRAILNPWRDVTRRFKRESGIGLCIAGVADRSGLLHDPDGLTDSMMDAVTHAKAAGGSIRDVSSAMEPIERAVEIATARTLFVDATAAPGMTSIWCEALNAGAGVILANKLPLCDAWEHSRLLFEHPRSRYEATVGAGLPILSTLRNLIQTGDSIAEIQGVLSGTLGYLGGQLSSGVPFSQALAEAIRLGYSEPDPKDDLSGRDVARKAVILSRSVGWPAEISSVILEGLVTDIELSRPLPFMPDPLLDLSFRMQFAEAQRRGDVLRYLAQVSAEGIRVGLTSVHHASTLASLEGPENCVSLRTKRYSHHPLTIAGPGAGVDVTAVGVLGDLIDLARIGHVEGDEPCVR